MSVMITLQGLNGVAIARFAAEDHISLAQMFGNNSIVFPTSCGIGMCGVCTCKIITEGEHIQIDKITTPSRVLQRHDDGSFAEVLQKYWHVYEESKQVLSKILLLMKLF